MEAGLRINCTRRKGPWLRSELWRTPTEHLLYARPCSEHVPHVISLSPHIHR